MNANRIVVSKTKTRVALLITACVIACGVHWNNVASASSESQNDPVFPVSAGVEGENAEQVQGPLTDSEQASLLPHKDLDRKEVLELLEGVFSPELEAPAGPFDELEVKKFLADNVAVIAKGAQPEPVEGEADSDYVGPSLMVSTLPLRTEGQQGSNKPIELNLDHAENDLQPSNPLVEINLPTEIGKGIDLPETGVRIDVEATQDQVAPTIVDQSVAVYPNVADDTDFVIAPTPTGVETFTHIRSIDAPTSQTFDLDVPDNASLARTEEGGAVVVRDGKTLIEIPPPDAIDAVGNRVPVALEVDGDSLVLTVEPEDPVQYPILVDPLFQSYKWEAGKTQTGIHYSDTGEEEWTPQNASAYYEYPYCNPCRPYKTASAQESPVGLAVNSGWYSVKKGEHAAWIYTVPRYFKDSEKPTSFISNFTLTGLTQWANSPYHDPYLEAGIWDVYKGEWGSPIIYHEGLAEHSLNDANWEYKMPNSNGNVNDKIASVGLWATQDTPNGPGNVKVTSAIVELAEPTDPTKNKPTWGSIYPPEVWMNQSALPVEFSVVDTGLGVQTLLTGNGTENWTTSYGCIGVGGSACPRVWVRPYGSQPDLKYDPAKLPQGINKLSVVAEDPLGHSSEATFQVKVDHTPPFLTLAGAITEQGSLGNSRPTYELDINAKDGTAGAPQSGVTKTVIEIDGKVVNESAPGCATQNCDGSRKWTVDSSQYAIGQHLLKVVATDAVGLQTTKSQSFNLQPAAPPKVELAGSATQQATLGASRPRYVLNVNASTEAGFNGKPIAAPTYALSFGGTGEGKGQFYGAKANAVDSKGNVWIVDCENGRVEGFNTKGEYLGQISEPGSNPGQLKIPEGLAIDAAGNFWVTSQDGRIQEFSSAGKFIRQFGKEGKEDGAFKNPSDIGIDSKGSLWILDTSLARIQEFNSEGKFLFKFGTQGKANGQFSAPWGLAIAPDGSIWIADSGNDRLQKFNSEGKFLAAYGETGSGNGNFSSPDGIRIDQAGNVYVADGANGRVQVFNGAGEYLIQFGSLGSGPGQFGFPSYLSVDSFGNIWVDAGSDKIQRWHAQVPPPTFSASFGSKGTGAGQFTTPSGIVVNSSGKVFVVDRSNGRIEKFGENGEFLSQFGSKGSLGGQLSSPYGVAMDPTGNIWVTDTANTRVVKFNGSGEFLSTFGTNVNKTKVETGGTQAEKNICTAASKNVCQAGTAGGAEGQMKQPTGIAISSGGNLFVVEKGNGRVEKFSPTGELLANFGKPGTAEGQLTEPSAVAISPDGNYLWVADSANSRIQEWTSAYSFVRAVGKEGTTNGQFIEPYGLTIDAKGNVWVADTSMNRIQGFSPDGDFITRFGKSGSGEGQMSIPYAVTADSSGSLWVADTGHNQIQKWVPPTSKASTITSEITIDGTSVSTKVGRCGTEACAVTPEWTLEAGSYASGKHTIQVKATDGLGRSTTKTLSIELQKDIIKPILETSGALVSAPEGWVEQQSYNLNATATDAGYGLTSLIAKIDGKQVASWTGTCPDGACKATISKAIDMNAYGGGSHPAEVVATDGAGNAATKAWTINVDPDGHVATTEAIDTLEAADDTGDTMIVAPASEELEPEQMEGGDNPSLVVASNQIESKGIPNTTIMSTSPGGGFTIEGPDAKTTFTPFVGEGANETKVTEAIAAVSANTANSVDSIIRPVFNGAQTFQAIRSIDAPEKYSWSIKLASGQKLVGVDDQFAKVIYEDGSTAFLITAEAAHDVTGHEVPTLITVSGNVLTLTVAFKSGSFTFPIIAGQGWETSYEIPKYVYLPEDEYEVKQREEQEKLLAEGSEPTEPVKHPFSPELGRTLLSVGKEGIVGTTAAPPNPSSGGEASASKIRTFTVKPYDVCGLSCDHWLIYLRNPSFIRGYDWAHWEAGSEVHCGTGQSWLFELTIHPSQPDPGCGYTGPMKVWKGEGKHLTIWGRYKIAADVATENIEWQEKNFIALQIWVWPNGWQEEWIGHWNCIDMFYC